MITNDEINSLSLGMLPRAISQAKVTPSLVSQIQNFFTTANRTHLCVEKNVINFFFYFFYFLTTKSLVKLFYLLFFPK